MFEWRLDLRDFNAIRDWLTQYGAWARNEVSGIWLPTHKVESMVAASRLRWQTDDDPMEC